MCGIFGWSLAEPPNKAMRRHLKTLATTLMLSMEQRGTDSWGFLGDTTLVRGMGAICDSVPPDELVRFQTLMGHTRYATVGDKTLHNAHPLRAGDVVGVHNGAVYNYRDLNKKYDRKFEVDSTHVFAHIAEGKPLREIQGYGAIAWKLKGEPQVVRLAYWNDGDLAVWKLGEAGVVWASSGRAIGKGIHMARMRGGPYELAESRVYVATRGDMRRSDEELGFRPRWKSYKTEVKGKWDRGYYWELDEDGEATQTAYDATDMYSAGPYDQSWRGSGAHMRTAHDRESRVVSDGGKGYVVVDRRVVPVAEIHSEDAARRAARDAVGSDAAPKALSVQPTHNVDQATLDTIVADVEQFRAEQALKRAQGGDARVDMSTGQLIVPGPEGVD